MLRLTIRFRILNQAYFVVLFFFTFTLFFLDEKLWETNWHQLTAYIGGGDTLCNILMTLHQGPRSMIFASIGLDRATKFFEHTQPPFLSKKCHLAIWRSN